MFADQCLQTGRQSAIDTGTTAIAGPTADVAAVYANIPGSVALTGDDAGFYTFPCSTNVDFALTFGGLSYPVNPVDFNLGPVTDGSSDCVGSLFVLDT